MEEFEFPIFRISIVTFKTNFFNVLFYFSSSTYFLGQRQGFNDQLNDTSTRFTYFAPRDYAWHVAAISYPSTSKKIFMPEFSYHVSVSSYVYIIPRNNILKLFTFLYCQKWLSNLENNLSPFISLISINFNIKIYS